MNQNGDSPYQGQDVVIYPASISTSIYTWIVRRKFFKWGEKSKIMYPVSIRNGSGIQVGNGVFIREHAWLNVTLNAETAKPVLFIGDYTYIGRFAHINAYEQVHIGSRVLIADRVYISDVEHEYKLRDTPIIYQKPCSKGKVVLRDGAWIGINAVILSGVTIGRNSVVGANSVVTHDVPDYCVVAGNPAKVIKKLS